MDWAGPPGGLEKLFAQYDYITHGAHHEAADPSSDKPKPSPNEPTPSPDEPTPAPPPPPIDKPPWMPDDEGGGLGALIAGGVAAKGAQVARAALPELTEPLLGGAAEGLGAEAVGLAPEAAMGFAEAAPGLALGLAGIAAVDKMERSQYKNAPTRQDDYRFVVDGKDVPMKPGFYKKDPLTAPEAPVTFKGDEKGLDDAYANAYGQGTAYDPATKTLYIKGSSTPTDWANDVTLIPFGLTAHSERYQQAMTAYNDLLDRGNEVKRVVGHSLGGSVALQMQKDLAKKGVKVDSRTFGAPVDDKTPFGRYFTKAERFRHPADPVSLLDRTAQWGDWKAYPHSYHGFAEKFDKPQDVLKA
jgi:hypothetical protein